MNLLTIDEMWSLLTLFDGYSTNESEKIFKTMETSSKKIKSIQSILQLATSSIAS